MWSSCPPYELIRSIKLVYEEVSTYTSPGKIAKGKGRHSVFSHREKYVDPYSNELLAVHLYLSFCNSVLLRGDGMLSKIVTYVYLI